MNKEMINRSITALKTHKNIQNLLLLFLYFTAISLSMIVSGFTFLGSNDGLNLLSFLIAGESRTLLMSYPLSGLIAALYDNVPGVQWYSLMIFIYMSIISLLFSLYISKMQDKYLKLISIILATCILLEAWMGITITFVTLLLTALAVPLIRNHQVGFWAIILLASFLRVQIIFSILPLFIITYLLLFDKESLTRKKVITALLFLSVILFNNFSPSLDKAYKEWLDYSKARVYFVDLKGVDKENVLSKDEQFISYKWWGQDEVLLPTEKVMEAAGSEIDVIMNRVANLNINNTLGIFYRHKLLIFLVLITGYIIYKEERNTHRVLYMLFIAGLFTLLMVRDTGRVTFPLVVLWGLLIYIRLLKDQKIILLKRFLLISVLVLLVELPASRVIQYQDRENLKNEFLHLANKHPMKCEIPYSFPRDYDSNLGKVLNQNHFFDERQWISVGQDELLLPSWIIRHPYFYKSYNISYEGEKRKYETYYDFLTDEKTGFIGSKISDPVTNSTILKMYDRKYSLQENCRHAIKIVDESEHFSITQVIKKCEKQI